MSRFPRSSGLLVHVTSLPGPYGVGDIGSARRLLLPFLRATHQSLWQVLPLAPAGYGNSPYAARSAFAANPALIDVAALLAEELVTRAECTPLTGLSAERVDFYELNRAKGLTLDAAHARAREQMEMRADLEQFLVEEGTWLADYGLFMALSERYGDRWVDWPEPLRNREPGALADVKNELADRIARHQFGQFVFFRQWAALRADCQTAGISIVGDIPLFVSGDGLDAWVSPHLFKLADGLPTVVAGVPPDYFSSTGQLWGNPVYDWRAHAEEGFGWWIERFRHLLRFVDLIRVDHFRGLEAAWEVPAGAPTAEFGAWVPGPGRQLFDAVQYALGRRLPLLAEDLGLITAEVRNLLEGLGCPGMKVLQFAFAGCDAGNPYLPHNFDDPNCVVYTGTHDNNTTVGWYERAPESERDHVRRYLGRDGTTIAWDLMRLALASSADIAIIPLQDVLALGSEARMNVPGYAEGNWVWRAAGESLSTGSENALRLRELTDLYGRARPPRASLIA